MIYLDNSATTKQYDSVTDVMIKAMNDNFGNPSSLYGLGLSAEKTVKQARRYVAESLGCHADEIFFTSGGTESDNTALFGATRARKRTGKKIITTEVEHPAVLEAMDRLAEDGFEIVKIGVDRNCIIDMDRFENELTDDVILVSVMHVNNETGTIQPIEKIGKLIKTFNKKNREKNTGIIFHVDAVQSFGKLKEIKKLSDHGVDMISVSGHKIHGPKGVGALYVKKGVFIPAFILGGGQEKGFRSGTENVPAIAGFGEACRRMEENFEKRFIKTRELRIKLLSELKNRTDNIKINGIEDSDENNCCPSVLNISFPGTRGEVILHTLEGSEIYVSTGSACSSHKKGSHVLKAMRCSDKEIESAIRFSFGEFNNIEEMEFAAEKTVEAVNRFRKLGSFR